MMMMVMLIDDDNDYDGCYHNRCDDCHGDDDCRGDDEDALPIIMLNCMLER